MCHCNSWENSYTPTNKGARALTGKVHRASVGVTAAVCASGGKGPSSSWPNFFCPFCSKVRCIRTNLMLWQILWWDGFNILISPWSKRISKLLSVTAFVYINRITMKKQKVNMFNKKEWWSSPWLSRKCSKFLFKVATGSDNRHYSLNYSTQPQKKIDLRTILWQLLCRNSMVFDGETIVFHHYFPWFLEKAVVI